MHRGLIGTVVALLAVALACSSSPAAAEDAIAERDIREEVWALPLLCRRSLTSSVPWEMGRFLSW